MSAAKNIQPSLTQTGISEQQLIRLLRGVTTLAAIGAVVACMLYLINAIQWRSQTFPGFMTAYTLVVDGNRTYGNADWAGQAAGIQRLDRITAVNETPVTGGSYTERHTAMHQAFSALDYGDPVTVSVVRPEERAQRTPDLCDLDNIAGGFAPCRISYTLAPLPQSDFFTFFIFPFITAIIAVAVGVTLLILRPNNINALLISIFCLSLGVFSAGPFDNGTTAALIPLWLTYTTIGAGVAFLIALNFPSRLTLTYRQPVLLAVPVVVSAILLAIDLYLYANITSPYQFTTVWQLPVGFAVLSFMILLVSLINRRRFAESNIHRDQINTSLIGFALALLPIFLWMLSNVALIVDATLTLPFNSGTVMPFFITIPISMAYAVLQYRTLNTDQILSQGITYGLMLGALVLGYFFMVTGVKLLTQELITADNPFIIATTIFIIAVAFLPIRTRLQQRIDEIYFRERRRFQNQAEAFGQEISTTGNFDKILATYTKQVQRTTQPTGIFIFLPDQENNTYLAHPTSNPNTDVAFSDDSDLVKLLNRVREIVHLDKRKRWDRNLISERLRLGILKANLLIPLSGGRDHINGFVVLSPPRSQRNHYTYEEIRFLNTITAQMAISAERAQVVGSLERRVRELDVLSQVSQAVNFAVEFDDILELVSAQTQKVLEAPNFYIALSDSAANQMFYAFFMEYNERLRDEENRRWNAGNDLFSTVLEEGQSRRIDNYSQTANTLALNMRGISEDLQAWMGMPLIAGTNRLGVLAIGTTRNGYTYSDEQQRIFNDLGALAATSLDKARLFEETNQRARQLRALNDISRRLQSERNVERLIPLITSNAVEILDAEAGSLLLAAEDGSGDMEFRIVIGGSGEELVGTRVKSGHGIVGEVVENGKPIIVNDTQQDQRWQGEVAPDSAFKTSSVLAVPLLANNVVIGVLEVLNKIDGSAYRPEDADVLETFAGQAAIAIENARLFQKTDEQLAQRVQELETLERIDTELNRALDLKRVAEITVKWAIANTGASSGLLGILSEEDPPTTMRVLHTYGYSPEDYPDGAKEQDWPLDRGIVKRVIRTKQPDLQTDVNIDPDYIPSLRGGLSQITMPVLAGDTIIAILILEKNTKPNLSLLDLQFVRRLTDHAAIAIENARLYSELEATNKSQSRYMGVGAHELKNVLTPINGWADFLLSGVMGELSEQQSNSLRVIKSNVSRAHLIIGDLRDFAKMRAQELRISPEPTSIRHIVIETLRPFTQQIEEKNQKLVNHIINKELPDIYGDSQRLIQVMTNFVSNAVKYSPEDATITLDATVERKRLSDKGKPLPDSLIISIADTGMGISKEDQKKMFQPYFRTQQAQDSDIPGTGLGMSLTKEIIVQHGGDVWLDSEIGTGTTFYFRVPLAPDERQDDALQPKQKTEPASD